MADPERRPIVGAEHQNENYNSTDFATPPAEFATPAAEALQPPR